MATSTTEIVPISDNEPEFPRFDVVDRHPTDHHYYDGKRSSKECGGGRGGRNDRIITTSSTSKKIMQEWNLLDQNLPDSIYVRVYEAQIYLLRAAIVGAAGTPYQDNLFFFDIAFPSDYPSKPPLVHFRSFGYRINPNLYESGRVCLSLINTWHGGKVEKWDRKRSTILQLLLSIQALVLSKTPYFNEPGLSHLKNLNYGVKKSAAYNEQVFVLCCKMTLCQLRRPPLDFEALVRRHFRQRAVNILSACNAYRNGQIVISGGIEGVNGKVSSKFMNEMKLIYGNLVAAMAKNGGSVRNFVEQLAQEVEKAKVAKCDRERRKAKKRKGSSIVRFFGKLKKIWFTVGRNKKKELRNKGSGYRTALRPNAAVLPDSSLV